MIMPYKLYDKNGKTIDHHNLQDKSPWCKAGASKEFVFIEKFGEKLNLIINPEKEKSPYVPDLLNTKTEMLSDLKVQNTPFFQAKIKFGMDPQYSVVFNQKDMERYQKLYPNIDIYFWVDWIVVKFVNDYGEIEVNEMSGVWFIPFQKLLALLKKAPLHEYCRRRNDTKGNAKASYVLDIRLPGFVKIS